MVFISPECATYTWRFSHLTLANVEQYTDGHFKFYYRRYTFKDVYGPMHFVIILVQPWYCYEHRFHFRRLWNISFALARIKCLLLNRQLVTLCSCFSALIRLTIPPISLHTLKAWKSTQFNRKCTDKLIPHPRFFVYIRSCSKKSHFKRKAKRPVDIYLLFLLGML